MQDRIRVLMVKCWSCTKPFPRQKNPGGRKNQSRILVNCDECRANRKRYVDRLYSERMKRRKGV